MRGVQRLRNPLRQVGVVLHTLLEHELVQCNEGVREVGDEGGYTQYAKIIPERALLGGVAC
jgi:hypothetical protein